MKRAGLAVAALAVLALAGWLGWQRLAAPDPATEAIRACPLPASVAMAPQPGMAWVPGGRLTMGDSLYAEEQPSRAVDVFFDFCPALVLLAN